MRAHLLLLLLLTLRASPASTPLPEVLSASVLAHGDPRGWSSDIVSDLLTSTGFPAAVSAAALEQDVTGSMLLMLEEADYVELGVTGLHLKRARALLSELRGLDRDARAVREALTELLLAASPAPSLQPSPPSLSALRASSPAGVISEFMLLAGDPLAGRLAAAVLWPRDSLLSGMSRSEWSWAGLLLCPRAAPALHLARAHDGSLFSALAIAMLGGAAARDAAALAAAALAALAAARSRAPRASPALLLLAAYGRGRPRGLEGFLAEAALRVLLWAALRAVQLLPLGLGGGLLALGSTAALAMALALPAYAWWWRRPRGGEGRNARLFQALSGAGMPIPETLLLALRLPGLALPERWTEANRLVGLALGARGRGQSAGAPLLAGGPPSAPGGGAAPGPGPAAPCELAEDAMQLAALACGGEGVKALSARAVARARARGEAAAGGAGAGGSVGGSAGTPAPAADLGGALPLPSAGGESSVSAGAGAGSPPPSLGGESSARIGTGPDGSPPPPPALGEPSRRAGAGAGSPPPPPALGEPSARAGADRIGWTLLEAVLVFLGPRLLGSDRRHPGGELLAALLTRGAVAGRLGALRARLEATAAGARARAAVGQAAAAAAAAEEAEEAGGDPLGACAEGEGAAAGGGAGGGAGGAAAADPSASTAEDASAGDPAS